MSGEHIIKKHIMEYIEDTKSSWLSMLSMIFSSTECTCRLCKSIIQAITKKNEHKQTGLQQMFLSSTPTQWRFTFSLHFPGRFLSGRRRVILGLAPGHFASLPLKRPLERGGSLNGRWEFPPAVHNANLHLEESRTIPQLKCSQWRDFEGKLTACCLRGYWG
jgi:hypothetical protein